MSIPQNGFWKTVTRSWFIWKHVLPNILRGKKNHVKTFLAVWCKSASGFSWYSFVMFWWATFWLVKWARLGLVFKVTGKDKSSWLQGLGQPHGWGEDIKELEPGSLPSDRTRGHWYKLKHRSFLLNIRKPSFCWGGDWVLA